MNVCKFLGIENKLTPGMLHSFMMSGTATALPMSGLFGVFDAKMLYLIVSSPIDSCVFTRN